MISSILDWLVSTLLDRVFPFLLSLDNTILVSVILVLAVGIILETIYIFKLRKQSVKSEPEDEIDKIKRIDEEYPFFFGIRWDRKYNPVCPICLNPLQTKIGIYDDHYFDCYVCNKDFNANINGYKVSFSKLGNTVKPFIDQHFEELDKAKKAKK